MSKCLIFRDGVSLLLPATLPCPVDIGALSKRQSLAALKTIVKLLHDFKVDYFFRRYSPIAHITCCLKKKKKKVPLLVVTKFHFS